MEIIWINIIDASWGSDANDLRFIIDPDPDILEDLMNGSDGTIVDIGSDGLTMAELQEEIQHAEG